MDQRLRSPAGSRQASSEASKHWATGIRVISHRRRSSSQRPAAVTAAAMQRPAGPLVWGCQSQVQVVLLGQSLVSQGILGLAAL